MKKLLAILALAIGLIANPVQAELPKMKIQVHGSEPYVTQAEFNRALALAYKHYGKVLADRDIKVESFRPLEVWFMSSYYGMYFRDVGVLINVDPINQTEEADRKAHFIYIIAHEIGHHILNEAGVSIDDQHDLMYCYADIPLGKEAGFEVNVLLALMHCK